MTAQEPDLESALAPLYTIKRELGGGGMSRVFLATELTLDREVVIKVLPAEMAGQVSLERFKREIGLAARLQHAHIVPLLSAGEADRLPYFTMPYVAGESLRARLSKGGELPLNEAVRLLREVASALAYAHAHGVVHRDIKPENILLSGGAAMVTDFGVAKALSESTLGDHASAGLTSLGVALGTPAYMAPEQASADPMVDHRADLYAWGVMAYELLTGQSPFAGRSPQAMLAAHISEAPEMVTRRRASVPPELAQTVMRSLEKRAADRPQSAEEIVRALDSVSTPTSGMTPASSAPRAGSPKRTAATVAFVAAVVAALVSGGWWTWHRAAPASTSGARSVAVLPFENAGGDSTQEYFSDGMSDDIASALVNDGVRVAPRASSVAYKGRHASARDVGATLGVDAVLTGSVRRLGDRLHVAAELTDAKAGVVLASYSRDGETKDLFSVQHAITDSILGVLRVTLARGASHAHVDDPVAHELVLRGRFLLNGSSRDDFTHAIALFTEALQKDPNSVSANIGLATAWLEMCDAYMPPIDCYPQAAVALQRALSIDSTSAEAHSMMGALDAQYLWAWDALRKETARALALNPNDPSGLMDRSMTETIFGGRAVGAEFMTAAARTDPLNPLYQLTLEWAYIFSGQNDSVIAIARRLERDHPGFVYADGWVGYALGNEHRFAEAESAFKAAEPLVGHRSPGLAWAYATEGKKAEARAVLAEIERDFKSKYVVPENIAMAYKALGDSEKMYEWLEKGVEYHSAMAAYATAWPSLADLRDEPRYRALRKRMGLPEVRTEK